MSLWSATCRQQMQMKKINILLADKRKINKNVSFLLDPLMQLLLKLSDCRNNLLNSILFFLDYRNKVYSCC